MPILQTVGRSGGGIKDYCLGLSSLLGSKSTKSYSTQLSAFHLLILYNYYHLLVHPFCPCEVRTLRKKIWPGQRDKEKMKEERMSKRMEEGHEQRCLWGTWKQEQGCSDKMKQLLTCFDLFVSEIQRSRHPIRFIAPTFKSVLDTLCEGPTMLQRRVVTPT